MKKKSLALAAIAVLMVGSLATAFTLAYFTDTANATNTFTVGNVDISLTEPLWTDGENPGNEMTANPGVAIPKDPRVNNIGDNAAYVRMLVTIDNESVFEAALDDLDIELTDIFANYDPTVWAYMGSDPGADNTRTYAFNYVGTLASGTSTAPLFTSVTLPAAFTNEDVAALEGKFTIKVVAEAIQVESFADAAAAFTALDAELAPVPAPVPVPVP